METLPGHLQLASLLNSPETRSSALKTLTESNQPSVLSLVFPYLTLPTLLALRDFSALPASAFEPKALYALLDQQRDWVVSPECPVALRDEYLVRVFSGEEGKGAWEREGVKEGMEQLAKSEEAKKEVERGMVLKAEQETVKGGSKGVCASLTEFEEGLEKMSGGLFRKLDWSNVVLGGGAVLSLLTGKQEDESFKNSDFDLFLYGLKPEELVPKVASIIEQIKSSISPYKRTKSRYNFETKTMETFEVTGAEDSDEDYRMDTYFDWDEQHKGELMILKGFNAITLVPPRTGAHTGSSRRVIQIVLVSNPTIFDALAPFDFDACCVGYTGKQVVALPRAVRSLSLGDWTGGVNFLDIKLARKLDPSSATVSSRALNHLSRGFSLSLPSAALEVLADARVDLTAAIKNGEDKAESKREREAKKTDDLAGLEGLMRRKWNKINGVGHREAQGADYGPASVSFIKLLDSSSLRWKNGAIQHQYWERQIKIAAQVYDLIENDKKDFSKGKEGKANNIASYEVPYVPGFDTELLLGLKDGSEATETYAWSKIQHLQYIVKLPRNLLPLVEIADRKMKAIVAASTEASSLPLPPRRKRRRAPKTSSLSPSRTKTRTSSRRRSRLSPPSSPRLTSRRRPTTTSFPLRLPHSTLSSPRHSPAPYVGERRRFGYGSFGGFGGSGGFDDEGFGSSSKKKKEKEKKVEKKNDPVDSFLSPLVGCDGKEVAVTKKTMPGVWQVATLAGLWMFKGLDEDVDKVRDIVWQAHVLAARNAVSLPSGIPLWLLGTPENPWPHPEDVDIYKSLARATGEKKEALKRYTAQPSVSTIIAKVKTELTALEKVVVGAGRKSKGKGEAKAGEYDEERKRWLKQWVEGKEMV